MPRNAPTKSAGSSAPPGDVELRFTPSGQLRLVAGRDEPASALAQAFSRGPGFGALHVVRTWPSEPLSPVLAFVRGVARQYFARLGVSTDDDTATALPDVPPDVPALERLAASVPPMPGAEYVDADALAVLWRALHEAVIDELAGWRGSLEQWLALHLPAFHTLGRIVLHLAEHKADPERPFAFMATYAAGVGERGQVRHAPLSRALEQYAADRATLLRILRPLSAAAERDPWIRQLVESRAVYQPRAWTPGEALALLRVVPVCEAAGIVVRVPPAWAGGRPRRVQVAARVGSRPAATLGLSALLDFDLGLALGGEPLTDDEIRDVLSGTAGLRMLRGQWVEVDPDRLQQVLDRHREIAALAERGGLTFAEAMRLLARGDDAGPAAEAEARRWALVEAGPWLAEVLDGLRGPAARAASDPGKALRATLRAYQRDGVAWLWLLYRLGVGGVLADDMGLGKTIQVIALVLLVRRQAADARVLVVCPASLLDNWAREISRFAPSLTVATVHGAADLAAIDGAHVVLTTYGTLQRRPELSRARFEVAVVDEAQAIKNAATKQARAVKAIDARLRLALTGTPVENRPSDLWSVLDFACPGLLGTQAEFGRFVKSMTSASSFAPLRELVRPWILRRLKTDRRIIDDLPDKTEIEVRCGLGKRQAALYVEATQSLARELASADKQRRRGVVLAYLLRFKQICNHPSHWLGDGAWDEADSGKLLRLREICEEIAVRQEKTLVFTQFREVCDPLAAHLASVFGRPGLVLHGEVAVRQRARLVEAFSAEDGPPFFVLSLRAGGTGLNLTAASHVIHFDRWWNPAVEDQATDRAFRIGQRRNVLVHKLVCAGTLEEKIAEMLAAKKGVAEEILSVEGETALTELPTAELLRVVQLDLARATAID